MKKVCALLKENNYESIGFYTEEIRLNKERIGFDVVSLNGERTPLARINRYVRFYYHVVIVKDHKELHKVYHKPDKF